MKKIAFIHEPSSTGPVGDFSPVTSVFSHYELGNTVSPFLLLDHLGPGTLQPTRLRKGVLEHPHRGFETITFVYKGEIEHRDSTGTGGAKVSPRNEKAISRLHPQVGNRVRQFIIAVYKKHKIQLVIVQDYRTYAKQDEYYAQSRTTLGRIITKARGGYSNHNFALAVDVFPIWEDGLLHMAQKDDAKNIKILTMIAPLASNHGLEWGGNWKTMYDPPHVQLKTGLSTAEVRQAVKDAGGDPLKVKYDV